MGPGPLMGDTCDSQRVEGLTRAVVAHVPHKATKDRVISQGVGVGTRFTFRMSCFCCGNAQGLGGGENGRWWWWWLRVIDSLAPGSGY